MRGKKDTKEEGKWKGRDRWKIFTSSIALLSIESFQLERYIQLSEEPTKMMGSEKKGIVFICI